MLLLIIKHLLQAKEVLSGELIQFLIDIPVNINEFWHHHMLEGVHSSVCHFYLVV
jgi:hypothetical protein